MTATPSNCFSATATILLAVTVTTVGQSSWPLLAPIGTTDFQQFNMLRLDYQLIAFLQDVANTVVGDTNKRCNRCFIFNLLICFARAKIFRHIADMTGALYNLSIGALCTMQGLFDNVGNWSRSDFIDLATKLDDADDASDTFRILEKNIQIFQVNEIHLFV